MPRLGYPALLPSYGNGVAALLSLGEMLGAWSEWFGNSIITSLTIVLTFVVLRLILRRTWLTIVVGTLLMGLLQTRNIEGVATAIMFPIAAGALLTYVMMRLGLLTLTITLLVANIVTGIPMTLAFSHWSATASTCTLSALMALTLWAFWAARAGQPLFGDFGADVKGSALSP